MTRGASTALALGVALAGLGCSESKLGSGETCTRSAQCEDGLVCVEGECGDDLSPLEDPSRVPMLTPEAEDAAAPVDAGADAAAPNDAGAVAGAGGAGAGGAGSGGSDAGGAGAGGADAGDAQAGTGGAGAGGADGGVDAGGP